ncbi:MAG: hypothetical protein AAGI53_05650 [Planctomycetota bacterium]
MNIDSVTELAAARTGRGIIVTAFVASLAAGLGGCGSTSSDRQASNTNFVNQVGQPISSVPEGFTAPGYNPENMAGIYEVGYFAAEGNRADLPARWVSEAQDASTELAAQRAKAQAFDIQARSNELTGLAAADSVIQDAQSDRDVAEAEARRLELTYDAELGSFVQQIDAQRLAFEAEQIQSERSLETQVREQEVAIAQLRSRAETDWTNSLAEHERMLAEREAVKERGDATISQMVHTAEMTEQRNHERVRTLRVQAASERDQTGAEVNELDQQIRTAFATTEANVDELTQLARTLEAESRARVQEILAQADGLETQGVDGAHRLAFVELHVSYADQIEESAQLREQAVQLGEQSEAEAQRRRAEAEENVELARVMFQEANEGVEARLDQALAQAKVIDARANEIERSARSAFVAAEVEAQVAATREQAAHQRALAKSEFDKIRAQAHLEAQDVETKLRVQIAKQAKKGKVTINEGDAKPIIDATATTPEMARGSFRAATVNADRVASFKVSLAKATRFRLEAEAMRDEARATHDEEIADFTLWWEAKRAAHQTTLAELDAFSEESEARVKELLAKADGLEAAAEASRQRAETEADSSRKVTVAETALLRSEAAAEERRASARVAQVFARADAVRRNGRAVVMNLEARRDATQRRGTAKAKQILTEAAALEQSGEATLAQMHEQIEAARTILKAELRRLDQSSGSFIAVARSDYNEALAKADSFERIAIASAAELSAVQIADRRRAEAELAYLNDLARNGEVIAEARIDRFLAQADAQMGLAQAGDLATRAQITADRRIADAWVGGQYASADAREMAVVATFDRRLAQNEANRNRAFAEAFLQGEIQRTHAERAVAAAEAHQDMLNEAVARLDRAQAVFQQTAQSDWDTRLALPGDFTTSYEPVSLPSGETYTGPQFSTPTFEQDDFGSTFVIAPTE